MQWERRHLCSSYLDLASLHVMSCYCWLWITSKDSLLREEDNSTVLIVSALATSVMIDQVTSLRERDVTKGILSGHPGVSKELLVTASEHLELWRLLLEYINQIIYGDFMENFTHAQAMCIRPYFSAWEQG